MEKMAIVNWMGWNVTIIQAEAASRLGLIQALEHSEGILNMKYGIIFTSATVLSLLFQSARAETVGEMLINCQKPDGDFFRGYCHQYISGVIDVQASYGLTMRDETIYTCFPDGFTSRQGASVFVKWANANPEQHHLFAHQGMVASLHEAFSCSKK